MTSRVSVSAIQTTFLILSVFVCSFSSWSSGKNPTEVTILTTYCAVLALLSVLDHKHHKIPNKLTLFPIPIVFFFSSLMPNIYEFSLTSIWWVTPLLGSLISVTIFSICYFLPNANLGGGDVKLATLIGSITGFPLCLISLTIGLFIFATKQVIMGDKETAPLALYLYCGTLISIIVAQQI